MNKNAKKLYDLLTGAKPMRRFPMSKFYMGLWGTCGTPECIGGHANALMALDKVVEGKVICVGTTCFYNDEATSKWLGLPLSIGRALFYPGCADESLVEKLYPEIANDPIRNSFGLDLTTPMQYKGKEGASLAAAALKRACALASQRSKERKAHATT